MGVFILFLNANLTVKDFVKISNKSGNLTVGNAGALLDDQDIFGSSICSIEDLDKDGITDLAIVSMQDDDGNQDSGAIYILFLTSTGNVKRYQPFIIYWLPSILLTVQFSGKFTREKALPIM